MATYLQRTYCAPGVILGDFTTVYVALRTIAGYLVYFVSRQLRLHQVKYGFSPAIFVRVLRLPKWSCGLWKSRNGISLWYLADNVS